MVIVSFIIAIIFEIAFPIGLAIWLIRRYGTNWKLVGVGVLTFIGSQVVHIPLLTWISSLFAQQIIPAPSGAILPYFNAIFLGLMAGLCEEPARWIGYRLLKERAKSWGAALTLGAGHGGIESAGLVGLTVLVNLVIMLLVHSGKTQIPGVTEADAAAFFGMDWYIPLLGAFERLAAIILHVLLSVLVWLSVTRRSAWWFAAAVLWHAAVDSIAVFLSRAGWSLVALEGVMFIFTIIDLVVLYLLWRRYGQEPEAVDQVEIVAAAET